MEPQPLDIRRLVVELSRALHAEVAPLLGAHAGRVHSGDGKGGDITFEIDERAEAALERFLAERAPEVAFYSEDRGMVAPESGDGEWVLVVDPVDGTRPAMVGLESCCVSVAAARLDREPTMADVEVGAIVELKSGTSFVAQRGRGLEIADGADRAIRRLPAPSTTTSIERMFWSYGLRGRPARLLIGVLEELIDTSSVGGASFDLGSATFDMTRIATGQLDAYIEPGPRIVEQVPGAREAFERVGLGSILNNSPYDLAAAVLCLEEAGAVVTDAEGRPLDDRMLLGSGHEYQMSCVAAANAELHSEICTMLDAGVERMQSLARS